MSKVPASDLDARLDTFSSALDDLIAAIRGGDIVRVEKALDGHDAALQALEGCSGRQAPATRERIRALQTRLEEAARLARIAERLTARRLSAMAGERQPGSYTASGGPGGASQPRLQLNA
ncbi:hypothetical protein ACSMXM_11295 [Pacificimonas sp. ICDLI1SI03]